MPGFILEVACHCQPCHLTGGAALQPELHARPLLCRLRRHCYSSGDWRAGWGPPNRRRAVAAKALDRLRTPAGAIELLSQAGRREGLGLLPLSRLGSCRSACDPSECPATAGSRYRQPRAHNRVCRLLPPLWLPQLAGRSVCLQTIASSVCQSAESQACRDLTMHEPATSAGRDGELLGSSTTPP